MVRIAWQCQSHLVDWGHPILCPCLRYMLTLIHLPSHDRRHHGTAPAAAAPFLKKIVYHTRRHYNEWQRLTTQH